MSRSTGRHGWTLAQRGHGPQRLPRRGSRPRQRSDPPNARLRQPRDRAFLTSAIRGAARRLGDPRCQELLGELHDRSRRPLREALEAEGVSAPEFLGRLYFYDGTESGCGAQRLAYTVPGYRVVYVCSSRFRDVYQRNTSLAEVAVVHEALHCLGLGENPPRLRRSTPGCRRPAGSEGPGANLTGRLRRVRASSPKPSTGVRFGRDLPVSVGGPSPSPLRDPA